MAVSVYQMSPCCAGYRFLALFRSLGASAGVGIDKWLSHQVEDDALRMVRAGAVAEKLRRCRIGLSGHPTSLLRDRSFKQVIPRFPSKHLGFQNVLTEDNCSFKMHIARASATDSYYPHLHGACTNTNREGQTRARFCTDELR